MVIAYVVVADVVVTNVGDIDVVIARDVVVDALQLSRWLTPHGQGPAPRCRPTSRARDHIRDDVSDDHITDDQPSRHRRH
jgi:hypothetical protein